MRYIFALIVVATLFTACQRKQTPLVPSAHDTPPDVKTLLAYPDAEVVAIITTETGAVTTVISEVAKNYSHPTDQPTNFKFQGSPVGDGHITVNYVCYGRFRDGDIYAFSVGTNVGNMTLPLQEVACVFNGKETLVLNTNAAQISIKRK